MFLNDVTLTTNGGTLIVCTCMESFGSITLMIISYAYTIFLSDISLRVYTFMISLDSISRDKLLSTTLMALVLVSNS